VPVVHLRFGLAAGDPNTAGVDHDHVVSRVGVRGEDRLVLAAKDGGNVRGQPAEDSAFCIDHIPLPVDVARLWRKGLHGCSQLGQEKGPDRPDKAVYRGLSSLVKERIRGP
jgi:hypothetical protein